MLKHIVMWRLADGPEKTENAKTLKTMLEALKTEIAEIRYLEVGVNTVASETASDVVLVSAFDNALALRAYQNHPEHVKVAAFVKRVSIERRAVDYTA